MTTGIILYDDAEAAQYRTDIKGWICSKGLYHGENEDSARSSGSTNKKCPLCDEIIDNRFYVLCYNCSEIEKDELYKKKEKIKWDRFTPIFSEKRNEYIFSYEDLIYIMNECKFSFSSARFLLCEPVFLRKIEHDFFDDEITENGEIPEEVQIAMDYFNDVIHNQSPVSYLPGKTAIFLNDEK